MSGYTLAVDYGTTFTVGVVAVQGTVEVLEFDHSRYLPSLVWLNEDNELVVGRAAQNQAALRPERLAPTPKREIGKHALLLGGETVPLARAVGAVLARVGEEAARRFDGARPTRLVLTHPAAWAEERRAVLRAAAAEAGLPAPTLVPEPVAAAAHYADGTLAVGAHVAVYDLGGGTFDVAVLRRGETGFEVAGTPGGDPNLGGEDFDDQLRERVEADAADLDPTGYAEAQESAGWAARKERVAFRREVREAKEALSDDLSCLLSVPGVEEPVRVTRGELNALIEGDLGRTVALLRQSIAHADLAPADLAAVYLTGGSSRIPLVSTLVAEALGVMPTTQGDPKAVVALGAVRALEGTGSPAGAKVKAKAGERPPLRITVSQDDIDAGRTVDVTVEGRTEPLKVKLPPLLRDGQQLRLAGKGPQDEDLFVEVSVGGAPKPGHREPGKPPPEHGLEGRGLRAQDTTNGFVTGNGLRVPSGKRPPIPARNMWTSALPLGPEPHPDVLYMTGDLTSVKALIREIGTGLGLKVDYKFGGYIFKRSMFSWQDYILVKWVQNGDVFRIELISPHVDVLDKFLTAFRHRTQRNQ